MSAQDVITGFIVSQVGVDAADEPGMVKLISEQARELIELLTEEGYAIVELPEPESESANTRTFSDGSEAGTVTAHPGDPGIVCGAGWEWDPDQAIDVGRSWIAAGLSAAMPVWSKS